MATKRKGQAESSTRARPYAGITVGVVTMSTAAILVRLAQTDAHSIVVAAWRLTLASLILTPVAIARRNELKGLPRRDWFLLILSGAFLAAHFAAWITSLAHTSVAAAVVLVSTSPIFVALASRVLLHERTSRGVVIGMIISFCGTALIGVSDVGNGIHQILGDSLALVGAAMGASYLLIGRKMRAKVSLLAYVYPVYGTAAVLLMSAVALIGLPALPERSIAWLWLLLMALGPQILGHSIVNWSLKYLSTTFVTIAILGEPIGSTLLAWWLLGENPTLLTLIGGLLILGGIGVASLAEQQG